jgi:hypothetical protein
MDCNICGKDIKEHSFKDIKECFKTVRIEVDKSDVSSLIKTAGINITTNPRHKFVSYNGVGVNYDDLDLEIMRFCLAGPNIKKLVPKWKQKANKLDNEEDGLNGE